MITLVLNFPKVVAPHQQVICSPKLVATFTSTGEIPTEGEILTFAFDLKLTIKEITMGSALYGEVYGTKAMIVTNRARHFNSKMSQIITLTLSTAP